jgi:hypothetical protein
MFAPALSMTVRDRSGGTPESAICARRRRDADPSFGSASAGDVNHA